MEVRLSYYLVSYQLIAKPGNKMAAAARPNPFKQMDAKYQYV